MARRYSLASRGSRIPTVAAIDGFALGGGLELALACDYRVAVEGYERNLGLPEVQLGIHPGFGGSVRSVQIVGAPLALDLMLTGRMLSPAEAVAHGLVDRAVPRSDLDAAAAEVGQAASAATPSALAFATAEHSPDSAFRRAARFSLA